MVPHEKLLADGKLEIWRGRAANLARELARPGASQDEAGGSVNFISHEWLSRDHPDPNGEQLCVAQAVFRSVMRGELPFRPPGWRNSFDANMAERESTGTMIAGLAVTRTAFHRSVRDGYVWLDYAGVPQLGLRTQHVSKETEEAWERHTRAVQSWVGIQR